MNFPNEAQEGVSFECSSWTMISQLIVCIVHGVGVIRDLKMARSAISASLVAVEGVLSVVALGREEIVDRCRQAFCWSGLAEGAGCCSSGWWTPEV